MTSRKHYRTLVLSDIHLGTSHSKTDEVCHFLSNVDCDLLILNGDIIDGWHLRKGGVKKWQPRHTRFFKILMKMMERRDTQIVYVRGNHDDFLEGLVPLRLGGLQIVRDYELTTAEGRFFVTHGDVFDRVTTQMKWLALLGDWGYTFLLNFNSLYNRYRAWRGKPYWSLSQHVKQRVKQAVSYISDFEETLAAFARTRGYDGIICGHIHHPDDRMIGGIRYLNSGDWVETLSALAEDDEGHWGVIYYADIAKELPPDDHPREAGHALFTLAS